MKKLIFGITFCFGTAMAPMAWAQEGADFPNPYTGIRLKDARHQPGPAQKHVLRPLSNTAKTTVKPQGKFFPLNKNGNPGPTPVPGKIQLLDKKGNPVTLWHAGQIKNNPSLFQDRKNK